MNTKKPQFIVLAGCEGAGKTTQIEFIKNKYPDAVFFREPGGTEYSEKGPRYLMLTSAYSKDLNGYEQLTQAFSGRSHNIRKIVAPAIKNGKNVFVDRFDCCSFAYQIFGMAGSEPDEHLFGLFESLRVSINPMILPDLYIIMDISPEEGMKRVSLRREAKGDINHFDERGLEFHARIRKGYSRFTELFQNRVKVVDAHPSKEIVWQSIEKILDEHFAEIR